jgi:hypothetical protein
LTVARDQSAVLPPPVQDLPASAVHLGERAHVGPAKSHKAGIILNGRRTTLVSRGAGFHTKIKVRDFFLKLKLAKVSIGRCNG